MNTKSYNMYMSMIKLAGRNLKVAICQENGIDDMSEISIKLRDRDGLVKIVGLIMQSPDSADILYAKKIEQRLSVSTDRKLLHPVNNAKIFIQSILQSRRARICQKQLMNYLMAERYMCSAYDYDVLHGSTENLKFAKQVITEKYSLNFIGCFNFDDRPKLEASILNGLESQAFDERYSLMTKTLHQQMTDRNYDREYLSRNDKFLAVNPAAFNVPTIKDVKDTKQKSMIDVFVNKAKMSETDIIAQLYAESFADIPIAKKRRRFVNLVSKNYDISLCPKSMLSMKRQFAQIEATTKHSYILHYFDDNYDSSADRQLYYFNQEAWMYKYIWQIEGTIYTSGNTIFLPDNKSVIIPDTMTDQEFLHRLNTVYAALFGFNKDDIVGGANWLIDDIRRAYTDEGNALYRLTMLDKRLSGE